MSEDEPKEDRQALLQAVTKAIDDLEPLLAQFEYRLRSGGATAWDHAAGLALSVRLGPHVAALEDSAARFERFHLFQRVVLYGDR